MKPNTNLLMGIAEAIACVALGAMCISMALVGDHLAWLFGFGSLTFAWDLWRRFGKARGETNPTGQHER